MKYQDIKGPIFVVGMPRSGTKLTRDIISNHPDLFLSPNESKIIPTLAREYSSPLSDQDIQEIMEAWYESVFYQRINEKGHSVSKDEWIKLYNDTGNNSFSDLIESFFKILAHKNNAKIWGEKTSTYLKHYTLLMDVFPEAKFVHIVRDPRDYCLSNRRTWGKHILRAAYRWNMFLQKFLNEINQDNVLHIQYEKLLKNPEETVREVCDFLNLFFSKDMLTFSEAPEKVGDARGMKTIKKDNFNKWKDKLSPKVVRKIEEFTIESMQFFNYEPEYYNGPVKKPTYLQKKWFKVYDGYIWFLWHKERLGGYSSSFIFMLKQYKWRV